MAKSLKKNYIYNLTYQILVMIVPLITTPYLSRVLGEEREGRRRKQNKGKIQTTKAGRNSFLPAFV